VAQWLAKIGITALLLRYRLGSRHPHPAPLQDAARAVKTARALAAPWKLDPNRIGIMGFSAGGHLASTLCTHFTEGDKSATDPVDRLSSRPDLAVLIYPVITLRDPHTNAPSRKHLLGDSPTEEQVDHLSNELHVSRRTPPAFLFHTLDDELVSVENSMMYFAALRAHSVPAELHVYEKGVHGVGLAERDAHLGTWPTLAARWLALHGFMALSV
jgi:acetyl esterase/lipase